MRNDHVVPRIGCKVHIVGTWRTFLKRGLNYRLFASTTSWYHMHWLKRAEDLRLVPQKLPRKQRHCYMANPLKLIGFSCGWTLTGGICAVAKFPAIKTISAIIFNWFLLDACFCLNDGQIVLGCCWQVDVMATLLNTWQSKSQSQTIRLSYVQ